MADFSYERKNDLGLASAPATEMMPGVGDAGGFDQGGMPSPSPSSFDMNRLNLSPDVQAGLGMAAPRTQSDQDYLQSLPVSQKIGLALQAFSAGVAGRENPIDSLLKTKRETDRMARQELLNTATILTKGFEEARKYGAGTIMGKAVINAYKQVLPPSFHSALDAVGTGGEEDARVLAGLTSDPDVREKLVQVCGRDQKCWITQMQTPDRRAVFEQMVDAKRTPVVLSKLTAFGDQVLGKLDDAGLVAFGATRDEGGKVSIDYARFVEANEKLKLFTEQEMDTIARMSKKGDLLPYGIVPSSVALKGAEAGAAEQAKQAARPDKDEWTEPYTLNGALVQKNKTTGQIRQAVSRPPKEKGTDEKPLTPYQKREQAAKDAAVKLLKDRGIEPGDDDALGKLVNPTDAKGRDNAKFVGAAQAGRLKKAFDLANKPTIAETTGRDDEARGKPAEQKAAPAAKPAAGPSLAPADRQAAIEAATKAVNAGADPAAVKKRLKEKYGIEVTFTQKKK